MKDDRGFDPVDLDNYITGHWGEDQYREVEDTYRDRAYGIEGLADQLYYNDWSEKPEDLEFLQSLEMQTHRDDDYEPND